MLANGAAAVDFIQVPCLCAPRVWTPGALSLCCAPLLAPPLIPELFLERLKTDGLLLSFPTSYDTS
jgi:hypothetical protein